MLLESSESNNEREKLRLAVQDKMAEVKANVSALPPIPAKFETSKSYLALVKSRRRPYANGVTNPRKRFDAVGKVQDDSDAIKKYNRLLSSLARSLTQCDDYKSLLTKVNEGDDEEIKREEESEESVGDDEVLGSDEDTDDNIVVEMPTSKRQKRGKKSSTKLPSPGTSVTSLESAQPGEEVSLIRQEIEALQKKKEEDSKKAKETLKKMEKKLQKKIKEAAEVKAAILKKKKLEEAAEALNKKKKEEAEAVLKKKEGEVLAATKKKEQEAALKKKKKEQDAEEAVLKKKKEGEVLAVTKKKKEEETAAAAAAEPKKNEEQEETAKKIPFKEIVASKKNTVLKKAKEAEAKKVADGKIAFKNAVKLSKRMKTSKILGNMAFSTAVEVAKAKKAKDGAVSTMVGVNKTPNPRIIQELADLDSTCSGHSCSQ